MLLDRDRRHAFRELAQKVVETLTGTLRFLEELAVVGAFTDGQVLSMQTRSESADTALSVPGKRDQQEATVTFMQQMPVAAMTTSSMPYLTLAGRRAGVPVQVTSARNLPLEFAISSPTDGITGAQELAYVEIRPPTASSAGLITSQGRLLVDSDTTEVRIKMKPFGVERPGRWPISMRCSPSQHMPDGRSQTRMYLSLFWPSVTVGDLAAIRQVSLKSQAGEPEVQFIDDETGGRFASLALAPIANILATAVPEWATPEVLQFLVAIDDSLPVPRFIPGQELEDIARGPRDRWPSEWQSLKARMRADQIHLSSYVLAFTTLQGAVQYEEFLVARPGEMAPNRVVEPGAPFSQEQTDRAIADGEGISLELYFAEDMFDLADRLRAWARDNDPAFTRFVDLTPGTAPFLQTHMKVSCLPQVDQFGAQNGLSEWNCDHLRLVKYSSGSLSTGAH